MKIGITGEVPTTLRDLSGRMSEIHEKVGKTGGHFEALALSMGKLRLAVAGLGLGVVTGLDRISRKGDEILDIYTKIKVAGIDLDKGIATAAIEIR